MDKYAKAEDIKKAFRFLTDEYGYSIEEEKDSDLGPVLIYTKNDIRVHLYFDYRDYFFSFALVKGKNTLYPNDNDFTNIKTFWDLALQSKPNFDLTKLQPNEEKGYEEALKLNAELLSRFGKDILNGTKWLE